MSSAPAPRRARRALSATLACALPLAACAAPRGPALPLEPERRLEQAAALRATPPDGPLDAETAVTWLAQRNPRLRRALAAWDTAQARVEWPTPRPNPRLWLGPSVAFGPGVLHELVPLIELELPLGGGDLRRRTDAWAAAEAAAAEAEVLATARELGLELRAALDELALHRVQEQTRRSAAAAAEAAGAHLRALVELGTASGLDVARFELEALAERSAALDAERAAQEPAAAVAELLAVDLATVAALKLEAPRELPESTELVLDPAELRARLGDEHPRLFRLRAHYAAAERAVEVARAGGRPPLALGAAAGGEHADDFVTLGLGLDLELPLFERNRQALATAERTRDEWAAAYDGACLEVLAGVDAALADLEWSRAQWQLSGEQRLPAAERAAELARASFAVGAASFFEVLEGERSRRAAQLEALAAQLALRRAWHRLERAVGWPLGPSDLGPAPIPFTVQPPTLERP
jgi:outer membrane protein TolC